MSQKELLKGLQVGKVQFQVSVEGNVLVTGACFRHCQTMREAQNSETYLFQQQLVER